MEQPIFWSALLAVAALAMAVRLRNGAPLLPRHATPVGRAGLLVAGLSALVLVFHCAAMFFGPWVDAIPGAQAPADAVRSMGAISQLSYWLPATMLVLALLRVWWPGLLLLITTLAGVGVTMYWPYALTTHLAWLAAVIVVGSAISAALLSPPPPAGARRDHPAHSG